MIDATKLLEQYPLWIVLTALGIMRLIELAYVAIKRVIEFRSKKAILDLENTKTIEREAALQKLDKSEQLSLLQTQYDQLADVARLRQDMLDEKITEVLYLTPLADRTTRAEEAYDLLKEQNNQQAEGISKYIELVGVLEGKLVECGMDIAFSQAFLEESGLISAAALDNADAKSRK